MEIPRKIAAIIELSHIFETLEEYREIQEEHTNVVRTANTSLRRDLKRKASCSEFLLNVRKQHKHKQRNYQASQPFSR
jgi:hypothetical protein